MAVAGVGIADGTVLICLIACAMILWILLQARAPVGGVPVVGGIGVSLIDGLRTNVQNLAFGLDSWLSQLQAATEAGWTWFVNQAILVPLAKSAAALADLNTFVNQLALTTIPQLAAQLAAAETQLTDAVLPRLTAAEAAILADEDFVKGVVVAELGQVSTAVGQLRADADQLRAELGQVGSQVLADAAILAQLAVLIPGLQALVGAEGAAIAGLQTLPGELAQLEGRVKGQTTDLGKLAALLGLAALGAVAIENLIRIARDPCSVCPGLDLGTVEQRLESLEAFGQL